MRKILVAVSLSAVLSLMMIVAAFAADSTAGGNNIVDRPQLDGWSNFYLVDRNNPFNANGSITQWEVYARNNNQVQLVVYRYSPNAWSVVGTSDVMTPQTGYNRFSINGSGGAINIQAGDCVGLHFPGNASVPFTVDGTSDRGSGDLNGSVLISDQGGSQSTFTRSGDRRYSVRASGGSTSNGPTIEGGNSITDRPNVDTGTNFFLVDKNNSFDSAGTVRRWEIYAKNTNEVQLIVYRYSSNEWSVVGSSEYVTPVIGYNQFTLGTPFDVRAGDYVGLHFTGAGSVAFSLDGSLDLGNLNGSVLYTDSAAAQTGFTHSSNRVYSVRATTGNSGNSGNDHHGNRNRRAAGNNLDRGDDGHQHGNGLGLGHIRHGNGLGLGHLKHGDGQGNGDFEDDQGEDD